MTARRAPALRWLAALAVMLAVCWSAGHASAAARRLALVLGNAHYAAVGPLENAAHDARDMGTTLTGLGFDVVDIIDLKATDFDAALAQFSGKIAPGDTVMVFYAGHGVMGQAAPGAERLDNYFVAIDAKFESPDKVPSEALALGRVLTALDRAHAGGRVIIIDACRDNPFADFPPDPNGVVAGKGLVQPPSASLNGVYIAFATSPGKEAENNSEGNNGLFTQEILRRINTPGLTVNGLFEQVSGAVEQASQGDQIPWFAAGGGGAANTILKPAPPGAHAAVADVVSLDLRLVRDALDCDLPACLESAAADVRTPSLRDELLTLAAARRAAADAARAGPDQAPAAPRFDASHYTPETQAAIRQRLARLSGWVEIGDGFLSGRSGFPKDEAAALHWYRAAAEAGSGAAAFDVGSIYHRGVGGQARNETEARRWFRAAANAGHPQAFGQLGQYSHDGRGGAAKSDADAVAAFQAGAKVGDGYSIRRLADMTFDGAGGLTKDPVQAQLLYLQAAEKGDPEAMSRVADFMLFTQGRPGPGVRGTLEQFLRLGAQGRQSRLSAGLWRHLPRLSPRPRRGEE